MQFWGNDMSFEALKIIAGLAADCVIDKKEEATLRQAIAEAEKDEPVAYVTGVYGGRFIVEPLSTTMALPVYMALYTRPQPRKQLMEMLENGKPLYARQQPTAEKKEPVAWMRMPKVGDRVVCIEDEDLGTVESLTGGGSPDIKFDDGSHGTYLLREFAELFRYADTHSQPRAWVGLTDEEIQTIWNVESYALPQWSRHIAFARAIEAKLKDKNT